MTLALADELLLITHDLGTGKAKLPDHTLGIGLAAALLSEFVFAGALVVTDGKLGLGPYPPPPERLTETLFDQTRTDLLQQEIAVSDWLASHRRLVLDLVADRMVRSGELRREEHRRLGRTSVRLVPTQPSEAFIRVQRLASYLRTRSEINTGDALLSAITALLAPGRALVDFGSAEREYLDQLVPLLPPPLRELLAATEDSLHAVLRNPRL